MSICYQGPIDQYEPIEKDLISNMNLNVLRDLGLRTHAVASKSGLLLTIYNCIWIDVQDSKVFYLGKCTEDLIRSIQGMVYEVWDGKTDLSCFIVRWIAASF